MVYVSICFSHVDDASWNVWWLMMVFTITVKITIHSTRPDSASRCVNAQWAAGASLWMCLMLLIHADDILLYSINIYGYINVITCCMIVIYSTKSCPLMSPTNMSALWRADLLHLRWHQTAAKNDGKCSRSWPKASRPHTTGGDEPSVRMLQSICCNIMIMFLCVHALYSMLILLLVVAKDRMCFMVSGMCPGKWFPNPTASSIAQRQPCDLFNERLAVPFWKWWENQLYIGIYFWLTQFSIWLMMISFLWCLDMLDHRVSSLTAKRIGAVCVHSQVCVDCNPQHDLVKVGNLESPMATDALGTLQVFSCGPTNHHQNMTLGGRTLLLYMVVIYVILFEYVNVWQSVWMSVFDSFGYSNQVHPRVGWTIWPSSSHGTLKGSASTWLVVEKWLKVVEDQLVWSCLYCLSWYKNPQRMKGSPAEISMLGVSLKSSAGPLCRFVAGEGSQGLSLPKWFTRWRENADTGSKKREALQTSIQTHPDGFYIL